ncbi:MAG: acyltransferase [Nibricoccus sp.]
MRNIRVPELDGIRGIAILFVLIWHYVGVPLPPSGVHLEPDRVVPSFKLSLIIFRSGVDLFFVLSGFLITGILLDNRDSKSYYRTFYIRRLCRIFPLYYTVLMIFIIMKGVGARGPLFDGTVPLTAYILMVQNYAMAALQTYGAAWLGVTWSLAVEEQFYLSYPLVIRIAGRALPWILVGGIVVAPILRIVCLYHFGGSDWVPYVWLPCRLDSLCFGGLIAYVMRRPATFAVLCKRQTILGVGSVVLLIGAIFLDAALARNLGYHMSMWGHSLLGALYGILVLLVLINVGRSFVGFLRWKPLLFLGKVSYGIYLLHGIVLQSLFDGLGRPVALNDFVDVGVVAAAFVLTILLCGVSYRWLELPFLRSGANQIYA